VPLARTGETRDALIQKINTANLADLLGPNGPLERAFQAALRDKEIVVADLTGPGQNHVVDPYEWAFQDIPAEKTQEGKALDQEQKRSLVAHLLFNLPAAYEPVQRVLIVTGLKAYAQEGNNQALALGRMTDRMQLLITGDRNTFVLNHQRAIPQLQVLAQTLADRTAFLARQNETLEKHQRLIEARRTEINGSEDGKIKGLLTQLSEARGQTQGLLQELANEQQLLFQAQNVVGAGQSNNEKLLREIEKVEQANPSPER